MKRKTFAALAAVCLVLCLILAGCGTVSEEDYPPLEKVDLPSMTLETVGNSTVSVQYPADKWTGSDDTSPLIIYYTDTLDTGEAVNINVQQSGTYSGKFTEKYMNKLTDGITESFPNIEILRAELRSINGKSVIYTETVTRFNDEMLDLLLEQGVLTQDDVDAAGGRDAILSIPPTDQITLYAVTGAYLYIYTGTYYEESQKADWLQAMTVMAQTTAEVKEPATLHRKTEQTT